MEQGIPALQSMSFAEKSLEPEYINGPNSDLIGIKFGTLVKHIDRLNDLITVARNILATTSKAQDTSAASKFDQMILKLIDICVKVTAHGYDGEVGTRNEEKWQKVVSHYKRLLTTCLQYLHNFIMHNETRKLELWIDLFGNPEDDYDDYFMNSAAVALGKGEAQASSSTLPVSPKSNL